MYSTIIICDIFDRSKNLKNVENARHFNINKHYKSRNENNYMLRDCSRTARGHDEKEILGNNFVTYQRVVLKGTHRGTGNSTTRWNRTQIKPKT